MSTNRIQALNEQKKIRSEKQAAEIIVDFEKEHQLFGYAVNGVSVWQILRFAIACDLQNLPLKKPLIPRVQLVKDGLAGVFNIFKRLANSEKYDYWVLSGVSALRLHQDEFFRDIYFDSLLSKVLHGLKIEVLNAIGYGFQQAHAFHKPDISSPCYSNFLNLKHHL